MEVLTKHHDRYQPLIYIRRGPPWNSVVPSPWCNFSSYRVHPCRSLTQHLSVPRSSMPLTDITSHSTEITTATTQLVNSALLSVEDARHLAMTILLLINIHIHCTRLCIYDYKNKTHYKLMYDLFCRYVETPTPIEGVVRCVWKTHTFQSWALQKQPTWSGLISHLSGVWKVRDPMKSQDHPHQ